MKTNHFVPVFKRAIACFVSFSILTQPLLALGLRQPASSENAAALTLEQILTHSSSGKLDITKARLITDNDESFDAKLKIVNEAKDNLYLTYYIYSNDFSSSLFNQALIKKARSGTKIKILVDLITNYSRMDLFRMLQVAGAGNIEVRFYNKPSPGIQKIALLATVGCSDSNMKSAEKNVCDNEKQGIVAAIEKGALAGNTDALMAVMNSRLLLAGIYAKSKAAAQVAVVGGQKIDMDYAKILLAKSKAQKSDLIGLAKSSNKYRIDGSISDAIAAKNFNQELGDLAGLDLNWFL